MARHVSEKHRPCIQCGVNIGEPCVSKSGKVTQTHQIRRENFVEGYEDSAYHIIYEYHKRNGKYE